MLYIAVVSQNDVERERARGCLGVSLLEAGTMGVV